MGLICSIEESKKPTPQRGQSSFWLAAGGAELAGKPLIKLLCQVASQRHYPLATKNVPLIILEGQNRKLPIVVFCPNSIPRPCWPNENIAAFSPRRTSVFPKRTGIKSAHY